MSRKAPSYISTHKRFWEIDVVRTVAVIIMIVFDVLYVLEYLRIQNTGVPGPAYGPWWWMARVNASVFMFLAGVSLTIRQARASRKMSSFMLRGLKILGWGMVITLLTRLIAPDEYVRFGILHFFGVAFILAPFFLRFHYVNLVAGAVLMAIGVCLLEQRVFVDSPWLLWLLPYRFSTLDYWPLVPWFGLFLAGMFGGRILYPQGNRRFYIPELGHRAASVLTFPGRHPLMMYIVHWPILVGVMFALYPDKILPYLPF
ncbi:MAG: heparan-alpha-glucosaminide N-acetyltransferase [Dehalococcoidia bacterium]